MRHSKADISALVEWIAERFERSTGLDACILGTAVTIDCLKAGGIKAEPLSVRVNVFSRSACELLDAGITAHTPAGRVAWEERNAWSVGVGYPSSDVSPEERKPAVHGGRFHGHLVAITDTFLIDPTLGQASRPQYGIRLGASVGRLDRDWLNGRHKYASYDCGETFLQYELRRENRIWRSAPDWSSDKRRLVSQMFIKQLRAGRGPVRL